MKSKELKNKTEIDIWKSANDKGLLFVMPCKFGETAYRIIYKRGTNANDVSIRLKQKDRFFVKKIQLGVENVARIVTGELVMGVNLFDNLEEAERLTKRMTAEHEIACLSDRTVTKKWFNDLETAKSKYAS